MKQPKSITLLENISFIATIAIFSYVTCLEYWPGLYNFDGFLYSSRFLDPTNTRCNVLWESPVYSCYLYFFFSPQFLLGYAALFQYFLISGFIYWIFTWFSRLSKKMALVTVFTFLFFPFNTIFLFYLERDVFYAWFIFFPSLALVLFYLNEKPIRWVHWLGFSIVLLFAAFFRKEGWAYFFIFLLQVVALKMISVKKSLILGLSYAALISLTILIFPASMGNYYSKNNRYSLNATLRAIYAINSMRTEPIGKLEQERIDSFFDINDYDFVNNGFSFEPLKDYLTDAEIDGVHRYAYSLIYRYPGLFFRDRLELFLRNFDSLTINKTPEVFNKNLHQLDKKKEILSIAQKRSQINSEVGTWNRSVRIFFNLEDLEKDVILYKLNYFLVDSSPRIFVYIFLLLMCISLICRPLWIFFIAGLPALTQFSIVFIFAPNLKPKYFYTSYLYVFFVAPLICHFICLKLYPNWFLVRKYLSLVFSQKNYVGFFQQIRSKFFFGAVNIIVSTALIIYLVKNHPGDLFRNSMTSKFFGLVILSTFIHFLSTILGTLRWSLFLETPHRSLFRLFLTHWSAQLTGLVTLGTVGSETHKVLALKKKWNMSASSALNASLKDQIYSFFGIVYLGVAYLLIENSFLWPTVFFSLAVACIQMQKMAFILSVTIHFLKTICFLFIFSHFTDVFSFSYLSKITLALASELLPIGLDGLGVTHVAMQWLVSDQAIASYTIFYAGKIAFKLLIGPRYYAINSSGSENHADRIETGSW